MRKRAIEQKRSRCEGLQLGFLSCKKCIGVADQRPKDQRQQESDEADDSQDHLTRAARHVFLGKPPLEEEPEDSAAEGQDCDENCYQDGRHVRLLECQTPRLADHSLNVTLPCFLRRYATSGGLSRLLPPGRVTGCPPNCDA